VDSLESATKPVAAFGRGVEKRAPCSAVRPRNGYMTIDCRSRWRRVDDPEVAADSQFFSEKHRHGRRCEEVSRNLSARKVQVFSYAVALQNAEYLSAVG